MCGLITLKDLGTNTVLNGLHLSNVLTQFSHWSLLLLTDRFKAANGHVCSLLMQIAKFATVDNNDHA